MKPHKYRAKPIEVNGVKFASTAEANRWIGLSLLQKQGAISNLQRQTRHPIRINGALICTYVADFEYDENGKRVIEDCKGFRTPLYALKAKLMLAVNGIAIRETKARAR